MNWIETMILRLSNTIEHSHQLASSDSRDRLATRSFGRFIAM